MTYNSADFSYYDAPASAIAWSPWVSIENGGILLATGAEHTLIVWKTAQRVYVDLENEAPLSCIAFSNNGLLASAAGRYIKIRRTGTWDEIARIQETSNVTAIDFCCYHELNKCSRPLLAYGTADGSVTVIDINSREEIRTTTAQSQINSVKWIGFPHTSLMAATNGTVIELALDGEKLQNTRARKTVKARKSSTLLAVPYQPHSANEDAGVPCPSILKNDQKIGLFKNRRIDYLAIGRSSISVAKRKIEYALADEGPIATTESGDPIEAVSWIDGSPCNFATGHYQDIVIWSIKLRHRAELLNQLINYWLTPDTISSVGIEPVASISAHSDTVTGIAYPPIRRSWEHSAKNPWLINRWFLATSSRDMTVKLWDISSIQESRSDYELRRSSACVGIGAFNGVSRYDISIRPKDLLKQTFRGLAARRSKQP